MADYIEDIDKFLKRLFPINRSITGDGNRETLRILQEIIPLEIKEYPSGQKVYDWTIPREWRVKDAWIKNSKGQKVIDFKDSNLHVVGYSVPVSRKIKLSELKGYLHYLENLPDAIPYRTTYYYETWGFCISYNDYIKYFNDDETYEVLIDSQLKDGGLSYGEFLIEGEKNSEEILISTYICHPSMGNDNIGGPILTALLAKELAKMKLNYSYRVIFVPETIGAIAYCYNNETEMRKINTGFVVTTIGGPGKYGYKQSWQRDHFINKVTEETFKENNIDYIKYPFDIHGSDERQYSSQGFRINTVSITKDKSYEYPYYHTSLDNLDFVKPEYIQESLHLYLCVIEKLEKFRVSYDYAQPDGIRFSGQGEVYENLYPFCEVMLSKHGLLSGVGGSQLPVNGVIEELDIILWLLFYCDGKMSLNDISHKTGIPLVSLQHVALKLKDKCLLRKNVKKGIHCDSGV